MCVYDNIVSEMLAPLTTFTKTYFLLDQCIIVQTIAHLLLYS